MSSSKVIAIAGLLLLLVGLGSHWLDRQTRPRPDVKAERLPSTAMPLEIATVPALQIVSAAGTPVPLAARGTARGRGPAIRGKSASGNAALRRGGEPFQYPIARDASAYIDADPEAEEYWLAAINDPSLSVQERQELIQGLSEDGLPDPQSLTADDLPLIVGRLELIKQLGPAAMDEFNADALDEAYLDLLNLVDVAIGDDRPVE